MPARPFPLRIVLLACALVQVLSASAQAAGTFRLSDYPTVAHVRSALKGDGGVNAKKEQYTAFVLLDSALRVHASNLRLDWDPKPRALAYRKAADQLEAGLVKKARARGGTADGVRAELLAHLADARANGRDLEVLRPLLGGAAQRHVAWQVQARQEQKKEAERAVVRAEREQRKMKKDRWTATGLLVITYGLFIGLRLLLITRRMRYTVGAAAATPALFTVRSGGVDYPYHGAAGNVLADTLNAQGQRVAQVRDSDAVREVLLPQNYPALQAGDRFVRVWDAYDRSGNAASMVVEGREGTAVASDALPKHLFVSGWRVLFWTFLPALLYFANWWLTWLNIEVMDKRLAIAVLVNTVLLFIYARKAYRLARLCLSRTSPDAERYRNEFLPTALEHVRAAR
ncbi:MAG: hypothetical protein JNL43_13490 [Flavobacteriales bacterium]|nr:hypothetical protein [Flavobacteriales bacterium]